MWWSPTSVGNKLVGPQVEAGWRVSHCFIFHLKSELIHSPSSLQVSRWSKSSVVVWPSSNRERRWRLSVSGMRSTALSRTSWLRPPHHLPTPRSWPTALRWATALWALLLWFTTPSCTTSPHQPESSPMTRWAWRAPTAWTPACPRGTTRPAHQITCPGTTEKGHTHTVMARACLPWDGLIFSPPVTVSECHSNGFYDKNVDY